MSGAVEVKSLVKDFGGVRAVNTISFGVEENEIFGLIGPNGAGKTTTLRIVSTLLQITSGSAKVFDLDVVKDAGKVRKLISYLPEDAGAYKNLTGYDYLKFMAEFFANNKKEAEEIVEAGVKIAKLDKRIKSKIETYSKGMIRRLLVGRALMTDPRLAVLDEPTSGLDVLNAREVRGIIKDAAKRGTTTVLLSSHNMLEVEFLCDRINLIDKGRIVERGSPPSLKEKYDAPNIEEVFSKVVS
jgi:ABC-2 type transport system ATP-binding protein